MGNGGDRHPSVASEHAAGAATAADCDQEKRTKATFKVKRVDRGRGGGEVAAVAPLALRGARQNDLKYSTDQTIAAFHPRNLLPLPPNSIK